MPSQAVGMVRSTKLEVSGPVLTRTQTPKLRRSESGRSRAGLALILVAAFMVVLDFSIVNVALASIGSELHAGGASLQWVITAYAITFGGLLVLGGRVADMWGRRRMFIVGLVLFSFASLAGGLAGDLTTLVLARAIQGIGAAVVAPAALSLITTSVPDGPARTRALGFYGATASVGFVAGLVFGGLLVEVFDWRAVLWVNVPIGLLAALLAPAFLPAPARLGGRRLDVAGALLATGAVAALVYAISEGPSAGWLSLPIGGALLGTVFLAILFVTVEGSHPAPLVPLTILRRRLLRTANIYTALIGAWSAGELLVIPLYLQVALHYSPLLTGVAIAPQGVIGFVGASRGARIVRRVGLQTHMAMSGAFAAAGLILLAAVVGRHNYLLLVAGLILVGFGTASGSFAGTVAATRGVADGEQGLAGGLVNMSRQVGAALGVAVSAAVIGTGVLSGASVASDRLALLALGGAALGAPLLALRGVAPRPTPEPLPISARLSTCSANPQGEPR
jgi:EmrB/QacA subfamily drug resistance transporter